MGEKLDQDRPVVAFSEVAEKGTLCALLNHPSWAATAFDARGVRPEWFFIPQHVLVYRAARKLMAEGRPVDFITIAQLLKDQGKWQDVEPILSGLFIYVASSSNAGAYLDELCDKYQRRQTYLVCREFMDKASFGEEPAEMFLNTLATRVAEISSGGKVAKIETITKPVMDKLSRLNNGEPKKDVIRTGIDGLDRHSVLNLGDMPTITGEKKAGKSTLALTLLAHVALELKLPGCYFSLEDRTEQVIDRLFASVSRVPQWKHHKSTLNELELRNLSTASVALGGSPIYVRDDIFDLSAIVAFLKRLKTKKPDLALAVVDYAQLVRARESKQDSREQEVARVSRTLRLLAMELRVAIVLLCQLNDEGQTRESRAIEMDTTALWKICNGREAGTKLLAIPFQRNGRSGIAFPLTFLGEICRFENHSKTEIEDYDPDRKKKR